MSRPAPDPIREALATRLGAQYEILALLGRGGMGSVYRARDLTLDRTVAIKVIGGDVATHPELRDRFLLEARTVARLRHPHLVAVYSAGEVDGLLYFVMEYIPGESLRDLLTRETRVAPERAERILHEIALALDYAHANGVIHRDVKPENILLDRDSGRAMLTDFGVARALESDGRMTGTGMILGSPRYMSPEQASGDLTIDGRSDLYALALVGYEMVTGRPAVDGTNVAGMLVKHLTETPPPVAVAAPGIAPGVAAAIDRGLVKDREARWSSGREMAEAIGLGWTPTGPLHPPTGVRTRAAPTRPRGLRLSHRVAIGVAVALVVALAWALRGGAGADPRRSYAVVPFDVQSGNPDVQWLRDGAVNMLTLTLGQWSDLEVVDYERTLALVRQAGFEDRRVDLEGAREVARHAGAGTLVMGQVSTTVDSLLVVARVYDVGSGRALTTSTLAAGLSADPRPLFENLARYLLDIAGGSTSATVELARATTTSLTAYRAYIEGVKLKNSWRLVEADSLFQVAIRADSSFALAWHKRALALGWGDATGEAYMHSAERAVELSDRLPPKLQRLVAGHLALARGLTGQLRSTDSPTDRLGEAQAIYRELVTEDPGLAEAWYGLGDAYFHDMQGGSIEHVTLAINEARRAFTRALELDPTFHLAYSHLVQLYQSLALAGGNFVLDGDSIRLLASEAILQELGGEVGLAARREAAAARNLALAREWARSDVDALPAHLALANAYAAQGMGDSAVAVFDRALARPSLNTAATRLTAASFHLLADRPGALALVRSATTRGVYPELRGMGAQERYTGMASALTVAGSVGNSAELDRVVDVYAEIEPDFPFTDLRTRDVLRWYAEGMRVAMGAPLTPERQRLLVQGAAIYEGTPVGILMEVRFGATAIPFAVFMETGDTAFSGMVRRWYPPGSNFSDLDALEALARGDTAAARALAAGYLPPEAMATARFTHSGLRTMARARVLTAIGDLDRAIAYYEALDPNRFNMGGLAETGFALYTRSFAARARLYQQRGDRAAAVTAWEEFLRRTAEGDAVIAAERAEGEAAFRRLRE